MLAFFLAITALLSQGLPTLPNQGGTVTGVVRTVSGTAAAGVRVVALAPPESPSDLLAGSSFASLAETDSMGRYRLENVPPGRYYIVAGRVDSPTFYPGTVVPSQGTLVSVSPGATVPAVDFALNNASVGRADPNQGGTLAVAIQVSVEGGGKVPVFAEGKFPVVRFRQGDPALPSVDVSLNEPNVRVSPAFTIAGLGNLPESYRVKSSRIEMNSLYGQSASFVLVYTPPPMSGGVRVTGRVIGTPKRSIYLSGVPGAIYADGTFEFRGVPPGQHTIITFDNPGTNRPQGTALIVGDRDLPDVSLQELSSAPADAMRASVITAGTRVPGTQVGPSALRGRVVDAATREPFNAGKAYVNGDYAGTFSLDEDGRFEIPKLLPGNYKLEVFAFGVGNISRNVVLDGEDVALDLSIAGEP